ncbi:MAG: methyltransferase domain-containing protein [Verrucomicrobia bacterium]|nr:methyltransferase domain-containing protein [Verrucomicrobiota bacterium]
MTFTSAKEYEDYQSTSKNYDDTRKSLGLKILLGTFIQHPNKPLDKQRLLDAGCGTGSFLHDIAEKFETAMGLDASTGMLEQAQAKLTDFSNVTLSEGTLPELPFPDNSFDAIMTNQVVHHLDESSDFSSLEQLMTEAFRVLAPGGSLVIHTSSQEQVLNSYWFGWVIPEAKQRMASRYAPISKIREMVKTAGFEDMRVTAPMEAMYDMNVYLDPEGPFRADWRACDSMFALASEDELELGLKCLRTACDDGSVQETIDEAEQWRCRSGQSTFISLRKP